MKLLAIVLSLLCCQLVFPCDGLFIRGDADGDGAVTGGDAYNVLWYLSGIPFQIDCYDAADANDSGTITPTDATAILNAVYNGVALAQPYPQIGIDTSRDAWSNAWSPTWGAEFPMAQYENWTPNILVPGAKRYHTTALRWSEFFGGGNGYIWQPVTGRDQWDTHGGWWGTNYAGADILNFQVRNYADCNHANTGDKLVVRVVPKSTFQEHVNGSWNHNAIKYRIFTEFYFYPSGPCTGPNGECVINEAKMRLRTLNVVGQFHNQNGPYVTYSKTGSTANPFDHTYDYRTVNNPCRVEPAPLQISGKMEEGCFSIAGMGDQTVLDWIEFTFELTFDRFSADPVQTEIIYGWLGFECEFSRDVNVLSCQ